MGKGGKMFKKFRGCIAVVIFTCATWSGNGDEALASEKWSMTTSWSGGTMLGLAEKVARRIEFLTDGKIRIEVFPGGTLGSPLKVSETVRNGVAEIGHHWIGYDWGIDKATVLFGGWTGGLNADQMMHWLYQSGGLENWMAYREERFDVVGFPCGMFPREVGMHSTKRVQSLADFQGLKQRTSGDWAEVSAGLGVSAVTLPGGEVYSALERGIIDAVEWGTLSINQSVGFHKIAKYIVLPGIHKPLSVLECVISKKKWDRISEHNQKLIMTAGFLETMSFYLETGHKDAEAYQFYVNSGNEIVTVDDEVIVKVDELATEWADKVAAEQGGWFARMLKDQREYQALWGNAHKYRDYPPPLK